MVPPTTNPVVSGPNGATVDPTAPAFVEQSPERFDMPGRKRRAGEIPHAAEQDAELVSARDLLRGRSIFQPLHDAIQPGDVAAKLRDMRVGQRAVVRGREAAEGPVIRRGDRAREAAIDVDEPVKVRRRESFEPRLA